MKIITTFDRRSYSGSPISIVQKLRANAIHLPTKDVDDYMREVSQRHSGIRIEGDTLEQRCETFIAESVRIGTAIVEAT